VECHIERGGAAAGAGAAAMLVNGRLMRS